MHGCEFKLVPGLEEMFPVLGMEAVPAHTFSTTGVNCSDVLTVLLGVLNISPKAF